MSDLTRAERAYARRQTRTANRATRKRAATLARLVSAHSRKVDLWAGFIIAGSLPMADAVLADISQLEQAIRHLEGTVNHGAR